MNCTGRRQCDRPARVVLDVVPWLPNGAYVHMCWPCYREWCKAKRVPLLVNYIDQLDKDAELLWDPQRGSAIAEPDIPR